MINKEHIVIVTDDAVMAAILSEPFTGRGKYVPVFEAPRMKRPDADREIITLVNAMSRIGVGTIIYSKVDESVPKLIAEYIGAPYAVIDDMDDFGQLSDSVKEHYKAVTNSNAAIELYNRKMSPTEKRKLAVVIATTDEVDSVVAANYAIARNADFYMINAPDELTSKVSEKLNKISSPRVSVDIRKIDFKQIKEELSELLPKVDFTKYSKVLFISDGLPFGITIPNVRTAHLPKLRLGISIASDLGEYVIALHRKHAFNGTILINRALDTQKEEKAMSAAMQRTQGLVKTEVIKHAQLSELEVEIFPYDILYIATHGSQIVASRETYNFKTDDGAEHEIVVDVGRGTTGEVHFIVSVDGIEKSSPKWTKAQGKVWVEYLAKVVKQRQPIAPVKKPESVLIPLRDLQFEPQPNGMGSGTAFHMLAGGNYPLVIVNACGSWNELNGNFIFAGCSAFIGTLLPVWDSTAASYGQAFFENLFKDELINVAHKARLALSDEYEQSLYVFSGTFESKFDFASSSSDPNGIEILQKRIPSNIQKIRAQIKELRGKEQKEILEVYKAHVYYLEQELKQFNEAVGQAGAKKK